MNKAIFEKEMNDLVKQGKALNELMQEKLAYARINKGLDTDTLNELTEIKNDFALCVRQFKKVHEQYKSSKTAIKLRKNL